MHLNGIITDNFKAACQDYHYLVNRDFPVRGSLILVGDRHRLNRDQRSLLYRGIASDQQASQRRERLTPPFKGMHLLIDGYNVLFTLLNYRLGRAVFISNDGMVRDAGSMHGKQRNQQVFKECMDDLFGSLLDLSPERTDFFLDAPVSCSSFHQQAIQQGFEKNGLKGSCTLVRSADQEIQVLSTGILATSDTVLIQNSNLPVTDLPMFILKNKYQADLMKIIDFL
jgi:hypothetical protein